jgi:ribonuclease E
MLINAHHSEEVRFAIVQDGRLEKYEVAVAASDLTRGNIYRGIVASIQPSLDAAFVEYGAERHGLLAVDDVVPAAYHRKVTEGDRRPRIDKVLEKHRPVLVQVTKDAMGRKGAALTTNLSIAGRYLVLMPYDDVRGISRKLDDEDVRQKLRDRLVSLSIPEGVGVIVRTNALDQTKTTLNRDINALMRLWKRIRQEATQGKGPKLVYSDQDIIIQALRDWVDGSVEEILVDTDSAHERASTYLRAFMPRSKIRLVRYSERMPLFSKFNLEDQIDRIYQRTVELPSGGSIVIEGTEALTAIDVNSARATRAGSQEETAYNINIEAAREVARQLRLRDIGGLVVVDFIDMRSPKHQRNLEKTMREAMKEDRARVTVGKLSPNGLLEINRQRIKKALQLRTHRSCPTCGGVGTIASPELVALNLLRRIETRAVTGRLSGVRIALHPELADAFQNDYRQDLAELEEEFEIAIKVIAATSLHRSEEEVEWQYRETAKTPRPEVPATAALSAADLAPSSTHDGDDNGDEVSESSSDKRRKRRGGRRRRRPARSSSEDGQGNTQPEEPAETERDQAREEPSAEAKATSGSAGDTKPAANDSGDTGASDGSTKKKRRPRRRRRKPKSSERKDDD